MAPLEPGVTDEGSVLSYIYIEYERHSTDPARVFRTAAELIDAFHSIEVDLARAIDITIRPTLLLEEIEAGSIRVWLRTVLEQVNDEALLNLDWKPLVGQYLVQGKNRILRFLNDKSSVNTLTEISQLQADLLEDASSTDAASLPIYDVVPASKLLKDIQQVSGALQHLHPSDRAEYVSPEGDVPLNQAFKLTSDRIEELLTHEVLTSESTVILKVKKPDYLGSSMWEFRFDDRTIEAKVLDEEWLPEFQAREHDVRPGDSLKVRVRTEVKRDAKGNIVAVRYTILRVLGIIHGSRERQQMLLPPEHDEGDR